MRKLTDHIVPGDSANHQLTIEVTDQPGKGGACHRYEVTGFDSSTNISNEDKPYTVQKLTVLFQNGPINEFGVNGVTHEALLAIVIDRLRSFNQSPFQSADNFSALECCKLALTHLQNRTRARIARGVEGTHEK